MSLFGGWQSKDSLMRKLAVASEVGCSRFLGDLSLQGAEHFARAEGSLHCTWKVSQKTKKADVNSRTSELESHQVGKRCSYYLSLRHRKKILRVGDGKAWPVWNHARNFSSNVKEVDALVVVKSTDSKGKVDSSLWGWKPLDLNSAAPSSVCCVQISPLSALHHYI